MADPVQTLATKLHELVSINGGVSRGISDMEADARALAAALQKACPIVWSPIGEVPAGLKGSGQDVLLWCGDAAAVGFWSDSGPGAGEWSDQNDERLLPTHFASITAPGT